MLAASLALGKNYGLFYILLSLGYHQNQPSLFFKKKLSRNFYHQVDVIKLIRTQFKTVTSGCVEWFPYSDIRMRKSILRCWDPCCRKQLKKST